MSDPLQDSLPASLADMLPVGMIAGGGLAAAAMAVVAQRKQQQSGWEAFHYERMSSAEFEITGGIAVSSGGTKKFQGAHDSVIISEAEILAEMRRQQGEVTPVAPTAPVTSISLSSFVPLAVTATSGTPLLKVVFSLPADEAGQQRILRAFQLQADFFGAKVQSCSLHDASLLKLD
ncbi:hypothetical protein ACO0K9_10550 [Undibacterium sp. Ji50W]|uniref:hypothetical protein n=1 Tax=Undibacterium sp. Ji50W TaxID=3413041 RepID=UPI003BF2668C